MREYKPVKKTVIESEECVRLVCDMCGVTATIPDCSLSPFRGSFGPGNEGGHGKLTIHTDFTIGCMEDNYDLCPKCCGKMADLMSDKLTLTPKVD